MATAKSTAKPAAKAAAKPVAKVAAKKAAPAKKVAPVKSEEAKSVQVTYDAIRDRAIEIYIESGCIPGRDLENWVQAEKELKAKKK